MPRKTRPNQWCARAEPPFCGVLGVSFLWAGVGLDHDNAADAQSVLRHLLPPPLQNVTEPVCAEFVMLLTSTPGLTAPASPF
jgi:hypothetical protein